MAQSLVINSKQVKKIENVDRSNKVIKQIMCNGKIIFEAEAETKKIIINTTHTVLCDIYDGLIKLASVGTSSEKQKELSLQDGRTYTIKNLAPTAGYWFKESEINFTVDQLSAGSTYDIEPELQKSYSLAIKRASDDQFISSFSVQIYKYTTGEMSHYDYIGSTQTSSGLSTSVVSGDRVVISSEVNDDRAYAPQADFIIGKDGTSYGDDTTRRYTTITLAGIWAQDAEEALRVGLSQAYEGYISASLDWQASDYLCYNITMDGDYDTFSDSGEVHYDWDLSNQYNYEIFEMPWLSSAAELDYATIEIEGTICDERHLIHFPDAKDFYDIWEY